VALRKELRALNKLHTVLQAVALRKELWHTYPHILLHTSEVFQCSCSGSSTRRLCACFQVGQYITERDMEVLNHLVDVRAEVRSPACVCESAGAGAGLGTGLDVGAHADAGVGLRVGVSNVHVCVSVCVCVCIRASFYKYAQACMFLCLYEAACVYFWFQVRGRKVVQTVIQWCKEDGHPSSKGKAPCILPTTLAHACLFAPQTHTHTHTRTHTQTLELTVTATLLPYVL
jgi:hypothetical protein